MKVNLKRSALMYTPLYLVQAHSLMQDTIMNTGLAVLCMLCFTRRL